MSGVVSGRSKSIFACRFSQQLIATRARQAATAAARKQIEDAKIAAEIELSGFEARREKSAEFVTKVKQRNELTVYQLVAGTETQSLAQDIKIIMQAIQRIDEKIAAFAPVSLVDDRVTIHPLEWTQ